MSQAPLAAAPITVWVKRMDVSGTQYVAVKGVDMLETLDDFKARWLAQAKLDVDPSLVTLWLVKCGARKPTPTQETKATELDDPSLSMAEAKVTGTSWVLAYLAGKRILCVAICASLSTLSIDPDALAMLCALGLLRWRWWTR